MEELKDNNTGEVTGLFESMAEAFISQIEAIKQRTGGHTDNLFDYERAILAGISEHLQKLAASLNWFAPAVSRRFYPTMRECADLLALERKEARKLARRRPVEDGGELDSHEELPFWARTEPGAAFVRLSATTGEKTNVTEILAASS